MGFFSSVAKPFKKIVKGVGKLFKGVGKAVKKFASSKIGKIILIAAAIWLGGAALGYWNTGFASVDGALVASQAASTAGAAAGAEAAAAGAGAVASEGAAAAATGGLSGSAAGTAAATGAAEAGGVAAGVGGGTAAAAPTGAYGTLSAGGYGTGTGLTTGGGVGLTAPASALTPAAASPGFMATAGKAATGAAKWMAANPIPTLVGGQMLAGAFTPNALDVAEQENQFRIQEEERRQAEIDEANARLAQVGGIPTWQYSGAKLPPPQPPAGQAPMLGIMGRRMTL